MGKYVTEEAGTRSLIRAALGSCPCNDVEDDPDQGNTKDHGCDSDVNSQKIAGEGTTE